MKKTFQSIGYKLLSTLVIATTFPMLVYCFFFSVRYEEICREQLYRTDSAHMADCFQQHRTFPVYQHRRCK